MLVGVDAPGIIGPNNEHPLIRLVVFCFPLPSRAFAHLLAPPPAWLFAPGESAKKKAGNLESLMWFRFTLFLGQLPMWAFIIPPRLCSATVYYMPKPLHFACQHPPCSRPPTPPARQSVSQSADWRTVTSHMAAWLPLSPLGYQQMLSLIFLGTRKSLF